MKTPLRLNAYLIWQEAASALQASQPYWFQWQYQAGGQQIKRISVVQSATEALAKIKELQTHNLHVKVILETGENEAVPTLVESPTEDFDFLIRCYYPTEVQHNLCTPDEDVVTLWKQIIQNPVSSVALGHWDQALWTAYGTVLGQWINTLCLEDRQQWVPSRTLKAKEFAAKPTHPGQFELRTFPGAWINVARNGEIVQGGAFLEVPAVAVGRYRSNHTDFANHWQAHFAQSPSKFENKWWKHWLELTWILPRVTVALASVILAVALWPSAQVLDPSVATWQWKLDNGTPKGEPTLSAREDPERSAFLVGVAIQAKTLSPWNEESEKNLTTLPNTPAACPTVDDLCADRQKALKEIGQWALRTSVGSNMQEQKPDQLGTDFWQEQHASLKKLDTRLAELGCTSPYCVAVKEIIFEAPVDEYDDVTNELMNLSHSPQTEK